MLRTTSRSARVTTPRPPLRTAHALAGVECIPRALSALPASCRQWPVSRYEERWTRGGRSGRPSWPAPPWRWHPAVGPRGRQATASLSRLSVCRPPFRAEARTRVTRPCDAGSMPNAALELGAPAVPPGQRHRWPPAVGPSCGRRATANLSGLAVCRPPFRAEARTRVARPCDAGFKPTAPHWELGAPRHPSRQRSVTLATVCFPKEAALLLSERGSGAGFPKEAAVLLSERGPIEVGAMPYLRS